MGARAKGAFSYTRKRLSLSHLVSSYSIPPVVPDVRAVVQGMRKMVHVPEAELVHALAVAAQHKIEGSEA